jgi:hypothetical protein
MDLSLVWDAKSFAGAALFGFIFGLLVAYLSTRSFWRHQPVDDAGLTAWWVGLTACGLIVTLVFSQVFSNLLDDPLWPRILSRMFPYLLGCMCVGAGMYVGLRLIERHRRE